MVTRFGICFPVKSVAVIAKVQPEPSLVVVGENSVEAVEKDF